MKKRSKFQKGFSKKTVIILVILAIILAGLAIAYHYFDLDKKILSRAEGLNEGNMDSSGGKVGIVIMPPVIEDKGA